VTRERRWIVLVEDGRLGGTLGRHTDPTDDELTAVEKSLLDQGLAGWVAITEGIYYSAEEMSLLKVRELGRPIVTWDDAVTAFLEQRRHRSAG
jgi:hypothetical protein